MFIVICKYRRTFAKLKALFWRVKEILFSRNKCLEKDVTLIHNYVH